MNSPYLVSAAVRNTFRVDRIRGTVTKEYISGPIEERRERLRQEARALELVPVHAPHMRIPKFIGVADGDNPAIVMEYLPHRATLAQAVATTPLSDLHEVLARCVDLIADLHIASAASVQTPLDVSELITRYAPRHRSISPVHVAMLVSATTALPPQPISAIHRDFKPSNILLLAGDHPAVIDWEHFGVGTMVYDIATMVASLLIILGAQKRLPELLRFVDLFEPPGDRRAFYCCLATRLIIEHAPALTREEYGNPSVVASVLSTMLLETLEQLERGDSLEIFVGGLMNRS